MNLAKITLLYSIGMVTNITTTKAESLNANISLNSTAIRLPLPYNKTMRLYVNNFYNIELFYKICYDITQI